MSSEAIGTGDIFYNIHTGDYLLLLEKRANGSWSMIYLDCNKPAWNWEYTLLDPEIFTRVA